jgi:ribosome maturation factor RimP
LYPDKTVFANEALMSASTNISGDYYYAFTTPAGPEGVYEYQATCVWNGGARSQSVTNSFHLSSSFTSVLGNLSVVQGSVAQLGVDLLSINSSLAGGINDLSAQLNANTTTVLDALSNVNSSLSTQLTDLSTQLSDTNSSILQAIENITSSLFINYTIITDAIDVLETNMANNFTYVNNQLTVVTGNQQAMNVTIENTNSVVNSMSAVLDEVNATTTNAYTYMTTTLANNMNAVLAQLGVINATVNRIETNTVAINSTVSDILQNQQDEVYMNVFSG